MGRISRLYCRGSPANRVPTPSMARAPQRTAGDQSCRNCELILNAVPCLRRQVSLFHCAACPADFARVVSARAKGPIHTNLRPLNIILILILILIFFEKTATESRSLSQLFREFEAVSARGKGPILYQPGASPATPQEIVSLRSSRAPTARAHSLEIKHETTALRVTDLKQSSSTSRTSRQRLECARLAAALAARHRSP